MNLISSLSDTNSGIEFKLPGYQVIFIIWLCLFQHYWVYSLGYHHFRSAKPKKKLFFSTITFCLLFFVFSIDGQDDDQSSSSYHLHI